MEISLALLCDIKNLTLATVAVDDKKECIHKIRIRQVIPALPTTNNINNMKGLFVPNVKK